MNGPAAPLIVPLRVETPDRPASAPFHAGEQALQARLGIRDRMEEIGRRVIRDHMPDQHRELFERLPFLVLGAADADGQPWAGMVAGPPGFVVTEPRRMAVRALPAPGDPVARLLRPGVPVGILGIELATRRRNRMNGRVGQSDAEGFAVDVVESFGNCPKYIQTRSLRPVPRPVVPSPVAEGAALSTAARATVAASDTFFIASRNPPLDDRGAGVDVSHRGGRPGFVRVTEERGGSVLTLPDFLGNGFFNTFGNLTLDPRCGLLFPDFETGHQLHLTARAEILWEGAELASFRGAGRLLRLTVTGGVFRPGSLPFRGDGIQLSPHLHATGDWTSPEPEGP
jgi:hypothetical protein